MRILPVVLGMVLLAGSAEAAPTSKLQSRPLSVTRSDKAPYDFDYDTDWQPKNSPVQLRFVARLHSRTEVSMDGTLDCSWPEAITMTPVGTKQHGLLSIDDGLEIAVQGKFKVSVAGKSFSWQGDIPGLPAIHMLGKNEELFDPWAWKVAGDFPRVVAQTPLSTLGKVSITDSLIDIPGISGGFELDASATFAATYSTLRIGFDEPNMSAKDVTFDSPATRLLPARVSGFDTSVFVHGEVGHEVTINFVPAFYVSILGQKFSFPLAKLPVTFPAADPEAWDFAPALVHVPLPLIDAADVNLGDVAMTLSNVAHISVSSKGEATLAVDADTTSANAAVDTKHIDVLPNEKGDVRVAVAPATAGPFDVVVRLASNDPLVPEMLVHVRGNAVAGAQPSDPIALADGCGCTTSRSSAPNLGIALGVLLVLRRRRRR